MCQITEMAFVSSSFFLPRGPFRTTTSLKRPRVSRKPPPCTTRVVSPDLAIVSCEKTTSWPDAVFVLSSDEAKGILALKMTTTQPPDQVSVDLGTKRMHLEMDDDGVRLSQVELSWNELDHVASSRDGAWLIYPDGTSDRIATHGMHAPVSLHPVPGSAPTVVIGGFGMHRFARDVNPIADTEAKILAAAPSGRVLDICTGLGYTSIRAAELRTVTSVVTIERDFSVLSVARANPWSEALFSSEKIAVLHGDAADVVNTFKDEEFDTIIHDPPALAFSGDLYSGHFYKSLRRICSSNGGRLFHYIGNPKSKESGRLFKGVAKRLEEAGFNSVETAENAFGIVASVGEEDRGRERKDRRDRRMASGKKHSKRRRRN